MDAAYYTTTNEIPEQRNVFHVYRDCPDGRRIEWKDRKEGRGRGRYECFRCLVRESEETLKRLQDLLTQIKNSIDGMGSVGK